jgi:hypothetical protein
MSIKKCTNDVRAYLLGYVDTKSINITVTPKTEYIQYNPSTGMIFYKPTKESVQCVIMVHTHGDEEINEFFLACNEVHPKTVISKNHNGMRACSLICS